MTFRVGVVTTHPIQYQVPWFRALAARHDVDLTVFFCHLPDAALQGDGFGISFEWDIPLLEGYRYEVLPNVASVPSVTTFRGCDNPAIYDRIRRGRFDAVLVNGWVAKSCLQALLACRRARIPCIVRGESNALRQRSWWKRFIHRGLLHQYSAFLVIGRSNEQFYRSHGISPRRMFPGRYCVDNERFSLAAAALRHRRAEIRAAWQIPVDVPVFLYCGKFIPKKHPLTLLRSAAQASWRGTRLHILLAGDGVQREQCEQFSVAHKIPVTFAGFLNQRRLPEAYAAADCLVLPSDEGETWGLVVNEAMASGLPAIVSDRVGCGPDLICPGATGAIFPFGDEQQLADLLDRFAGDRNALQQMGLAARHHVSKYSIEELVEGTMTALEFVTGTANRPAASLKSNA